jgi:Holliday junction resolvase RusA-like endonuclease
MTRINFVIIGQPYSKSNSRKVVTIGGKPSLIKSKEALAYERDALRQIPPGCRQQLEGPVCISLKIYYASERPDLDESLILDILQDRYKGKRDQRVLTQKGVYRNDRQVREKHVYHFIDKKNPRTEVEIIPMQNVLL